VEIELMDVRILLKNVNEDNMDAVREALDNLDIEYEEL
jgi:hypothetical protein